MRQTEFKLWLVFIVVTFTREYNKSKGLKQETLSSSEQSITFTAAGQAISNFINLNPANFTILFAAVEQLIS